MPRIGALKHYKKLAHHRHPFECFLDVPQTHPNREIILLFRTVIIQAIYEAKNGCPKAKKWLLQASADQEQVADYAETYLTHIRTLATLALSGKLKMVSYRSLRYTWCSSPGL